MRLGAQDTGIGKEDVEAGVALQGVGNDVANGRLVGSVKFADVNIDRRETAVEVRLVGREVLVGEVAKVDGTGAVLGELARSGAANTKEGVCA